MIAESGQAVGTRLFVREVLNHKFVTHVQPAKPAVKRRMDTFRCSSSGNMTLDLRGKTASRIQKDLRASLVADLLEGSDTAAFVCRQLRIDTTPRADQLELMVAAMPGRLSIDFSREPVQSDIIIHFISFHSLLMSHHENQRAQKEK